MKNSIKKATGRLHFLKMLLSVTSDKVHSEFYSYKSDGRRHISFSLSFAMPENLYQMCLDVALANLISKSQDSQT